MGVRGGAVHGQPGRPHGSPGVPPANGATGEALAPRPILPAVRPGQLRPGCFGSGCEGSAAGGRHPMNHRYALIELWADPHSPHTFQASEGKRGRWAADSCRMGTCGRLSRRGVVSRRSLFSPCATRMGAQISCPISARHGVGATSRSAYGAGQALAPGATSHAWLASCETTSNSPARSVSTRPMIRSCGNSARSFPRPLLPLAKARAHREPPTPNSQQRGLQVAA